MNDQSLPPQPPATPGAALTSTAVPTPPIASAPIEPMELVDIEYFMKLKLRVGRVESAEAVPKSKKLLKLMVNLGADLGTRQILAGVSQYYQPEQLIGRQIIIVANLKPATLAGFESQGMLLAAGDGNTIAILSPDKEMPLGSAVR